MPGGIGCSVATCKSNSKKAKERGEILMFFRFPKNADVRKEWIRKCCTKDKFSVDNKRLCSRHFTSEDFEDALQAKLMGGFPKKLKKCAVPSLYLLSASENVIPKATERTEKIQKKERKEMVQKLMESYSHLNKPENKLQSIISTDVENVPTKNVADYEVLRDFSSISNTTKDNLKQQLQDLQKENALLKAKVQIMEANEKVLKRKLSEIEICLKEADYNFENKVKMVFKDFLSSNQVEIALKKKTKARWTQEELSRAFTLRYLSKRTYVYLRETLKYPLPGISTLQHWAANINLRRGVLEDILRIMNTTGKVKTSCTRTTILSFDEVKVSALYEYDQKFDEIVGPNSYMQVVMARGLFDNWKQPVFIGFDQKMTKELLENIIIRLHEINYNVVACVSDCGGGNQGLWKELNITTSNTSSVHPVTGSPIYFFADAPHLLKLIRNWFIDTGFILENNILVNKYPVKCLIESTQGEISSCHKLSDLHLMCEKTQRQNVKLAAELFSNTTATSLKQYLPGENKALSKNVGDFFQLVNDWFDIMNSYTPSASIPTKKPYGLNLQCQDETLDKMRTTVTNMLCVGKKSLQIFQKGIIISITSLQKLLKHLREDFCITYILTHRLNQDCLENFFSQLRTRGGLHDHPSPLNAIYRIRMILLGKNPGIVQTHSNITTPKECEREEYLVATAFKQARIFNLVLEKEPSMLLEDVDDNDSLTTSNSTSSRVSERTTSEKDGLIYIAGYIAKKFSKNHPYLGQYTCKINETQNLHSYSMPSWLQSLSFGGLIQPSTEWTKQVEKLEKYFNKFHKDVFSTKQNIVKRTTDYVMKKVKNDEIPGDLIKAFCRLRVFIRIKFLNQKIDQMKSGAGITRKRKFSETIQRKLSKKLKKTVN